MAPPNPQVSSACSNWVGSFRYFALESLYRNGLQISGKKTRNFFEVLLTLFEPPVEFNADITRPAFGTHPAAVLASVLPLSADR